MNHPDQSALKARNRLLAMLLLLCVLDITLVTIARDWWAIGRILPTIVVMYFVIRTYAKTPDIE
jgi:membrane-associated HD superfamily phosphohydrolase